MQKSGTGDQAEDTDDSKETDIKIKRGGSGHKVTTGKMKNQNMASIWLKVI